MSRRSPYDVLGVPQDATINEVKRAYRHLARRLHPDRNSQQNRDVAARLMGEVNAAYDAVVTGRQHGYIHLTSKTHTMPDEGGRGAYYRRIQYRVPTTTNEPSLYEPCANCGQRIYREQRRCPYCKTDFRRFASRGMWVIGVYAAIAVWTMLGFWYRSDAGEDRNVYVDLAWKLGYLVFAAVLFVNHLVERHRTAARETRLKRGG